MATYLSVTLTQHSFTESLLESLQIDRVRQSLFLTPYRSDCCIDSIPHETMSAEARNSLRLCYQSLVGSLNWLAHTTRPDIATVVSLLAQHQNEPSTGHMDSALYVANYLASTKTLGIYFTSRRQSNLSHFYIFHFHHWFFPCQMPIGVHKMHPYLLCQLIFLPLFPGLCRPLH
jgi:hypothetical protein